MRCQQGDESALELLRERFHPPLMAILISRGASATEAEDLLADMWGECVSRGVDLPTLLERFNDRCELRQWLITVATHRLFDLKRSQKKHGGLLRKNAEFVPGGFLRNLTMTPFAIKDMTLLGLLRESVELAFSMCQPGVLLMLELVHMHGLTQRDISRMWGWHESKVSRMLSQGMDEIEKDILSFVKKKDPWLELTWQDFLELCQTYEISFF